MIIIKKKYLIMVMIAMPIAISYAESSVAAASGYIDVVNMSSTPISFNTNGAGAVTVKNNADSGWILFDQLDGSAQFIETTSVIDSNSNKICDIEYSFNDNSFVRNFGDSARIYFDNFTASHISDTIVQISMNNYTTNKMIVTNYLNSIKCNFLANPGPNDFVISTSYAEDVTYKYIADATFVVTDVIPIK